VSKVGTGPIMKQNTSTKPYISYKDNDAIKKLDGIKKQLENPRYAHGYEKPQPQRPTTGPVMKQQTVTDKLNDIDKELSTPIQNGPIEKNQLYKPGDKVPQSVLDDWNKEREKRK
jgi:hypothetical protein